MIAPWPPPASISRFSSSSSSTSSSPCCASLTRRPQPAREHRRANSWHVALMAVLLAEYANAPRRPPARGEDVAGSRRRRDRRRRHLRLRRGGGADRRRRASARRPIGSSAWPPAEQAAELRALWDEYERAETPDAKYAAALDRFMPMLHNYHSRGKTWLADNITEDRVLQRNAGIGDGAAEIRRYAQALVRDAVDKGSLAALLSRRSRFASNDGDASGPSPPSRASERSSRPSRRRSCGGRGTGRCGRRLRRAATDRPRRTRAAPRSYPAPLESTATGRPSTSKTTIVLLPRLPATAQTRAVPHGPTALAKTMFPAASRTGTFASRRPFSSRMPRVAGPRPLNVSCQNSMTIREPMRAAAETGRPAIAAKQGWVGLPAAAAIDDAVGAEQREAVIERHDRSQPLVDCPVAQLSRHEPSLGADAVARDDPRARARGALPLAEQRQPSATSGARAGVRETTRQTWTEPFWCALHPCRAGSSRSNGPATAPTGRRWTSSGGLWATPRRRARRSGRVGRVHRVPAVPARAAIASQAAPSFIAAASSPASRRTRSTSRGLV